ncbi:MAG: FAD-dependent oxidoreductase, partial [Chloroflexi bacterium]|nr:FAD-dependent oxidoreductase [Chloroflexota bacterium]
MFKQLSNIRVRLGVEATVEDIVKENPDTVIVATGGVPCIPPITGIDRSIVVTAVDVLSEKSKVGENVLVAGGGSVGCETANWLAKRNKKVTIVEMLDAAGSDIEAWSWIALQAELKQAGVKIITGTRVDAITDEGAQVIDKSGRKSVLKADTVVLALGAKPSNKLAKELAGKVKELYSIGDAREAKRMRDAFSDGFTLAFKL